jgi:hypothetical protein
MTDERSVARIKKPEVRRNALTLPSPGGRGGRSRILVSHYPPSTMNYPLHVRPSCASCASWFSSADRSLSFGQPPERQTAKRRIPTAALLPPYSRPTRVLLQSYSRSTPALFASCRAKPQENRRNRHVSVCEKVFGREAREYGGNRANLAPRRRARKVMAAAAWQCYNRTDLGLA